MSLTTDPTDPRLTHGLDSKPVPQAEVYLILSDEERAKGFVRPVRRAYRHVGSQPKYPLRDLTAEELLNYAQFGYIKYEEYPAGVGPIGRYWTKDQLENKGCGCVTTMGLALCETYARDPKFYGSTYCCSCQRHIRVEEFVWIEQDGCDGQVVGS